MIPGMNDDNCFLCRQPAKKRQDFGTDNYFVECRRCGKYRITDEWSDNPISFDDRTLAAISAATRQASESGPPLLLTMDNWDQAAAPHMNTPVRQKVIELLRYLAAKSKYPGDFVSFDSRLDYPTCDAATPFECDFLITHLQESGYLLAQGAAVLTVKGWNEVDPPAGTAGVPGRCFVAMSFAPDLDDAYFQGIQPAVEKDCGLTAIRMKELHHNQDICDRLLSEIRQAQFVIADFTGHREGVYYEAGYARALGREVINCCHIDHFDKLHFDTNHLSHIKWETPADLRQKLVDRIRATIKIP
jgi:hypothetical protein